MTWDTEVRSPWGIRESLVKRGSKRSVEEARSGFWVVYGESKLGDEYDEYYVTEKGKKLYCSCQTHGGGEYRKQCSHMGAVVAAGYEESSHGVDGDSADGAVRAGSDGDGPEGVLSGGIRVDSDSGADRDSAVRSRDSDSEPTIDVRELGLPEKFERLWPYQEEAVEEIVEAFERGYKVVFVDAPTGSGKTVIAETVRLKMGVRGVYSCTTKGLQDQFLNDFPYAKIIKGRRNYPTYYRPEEFGTWGGVSCDDCNWTQEDGCDWCPGKSDCPYERAKREAVAAPVAVLNTAYAMGEWQGEKSKFRAWPLVVMDECDELEGQVMNAVEVRITERRMKGLGLPYPEKKTKAESWKEWVEDVLPRVKEQREKKNPKSSNVKELRERKYLDNLVGRLEMLKSGLEDPENPRWVYTDYEKGDVVFKPVKVDEEARDLLWDNGRRFLCMSASIISPDEMAESLGLEDDEWDVVYVESQFDPRNRPVYVAPVANVVYKEREEADNALGSTVGKLLEKHPEERMLVHTVSFRQAKAIEERVNSKDVATYGKNSRYGSRDEALEAFLQGEVRCLLAPSLDRGVDLPNDLCRVQVICKVPWLSIKDKQVSARIYSKGGQLWYRVQAVRTMVQMSGRAVRHEEDYAVTYILDRQFVENLWRKGKTLFPKWWREALVWDKTAIK